MKRVIQTIEEYDRFLISTHVNPDPDALCSELAMAAYLRGIGKKAVIVNEEPVPERFYFLPGIRRIRSLKPRARFPHDAVIVVDCGELGRVGRVQSVLKEERPVINIDHHLTNTRFGDVNLVRPRASSTAEVLYELFHRTGVVLTRDQALHLYVGIMTDTGSFRYANTSARTHQIVARLLRYDLAVDALYQKIYETISLNDSKEFVRVINSFDVVLDGQVICVNLSKEMVARFSEAFDLRDALFRFLRSIHGIEVVVICTEIDEHKTRINLRSAGRVNVGRLAWHFQGGGHHNASGCVVDGPLPEAREKILKEIRKVL